MQLWLAGNLLCRQGCPRTQTPLLLPTEDDNNEDESVHPCQGTPVEWVSHSAFVCSRRAISPALKSRLFIAGTSNLTVPRGENDILLKEDIHLVLLVPHPLEFPGMLLPVPASLWGGAPAPPRLCLPQRSSPFYVTDRKYGGGLATLLGYTHRTGDLKGTFSFKPPDFFCKSLCSGGGSEFF